MSLLNAVIPQALYIALLAPAFMKPFGSDSPQADEVLEVLDKHRVVTVLAFFLAIAAIVSWGGFFSQMGTAQYAFLAMLIISTGINLTRKYEKADLEKPISAAKLVLLLGEIAALAAGGFFTKWTAL